MFYTAFLCSVRLNRPEQYETFDFKRLKKEFHQLRRTDLFEPKETSVKHLHRFVNITSLTSHITHANIKRRDNHLRLMMPHKSAFEEKKKTNRSCIHRQRIARAGMSRSPEESTVIFRSAAQKGWERGRIGILSFSRSLNFIDQLIYFLHLPSDS